MKKPQELHEELTKKLVTENYVDLKNSIFIGDSKKDFLC